MLKSSSIVMLSSFHAWRDVAELFINALWMLSLRNYRLHLYFQFLSNQVKKLNLAWFISCIVWMIKAIWCCHSQLGKSHKNEILMSFGSKGMQNICFWENHGSSSKRVMHDGFKNTYALPKKGVSKLFYLLLPCNKC